MSIGNVSFGKVTVVAAPAHKAKRIREEVNITNTKVSRKVMNVTSLYRNTYSGQITQAANKGYNIDVFITGEDAEKIKNNDREWDTTSGILSHMSEFINGKRVSPAEAAKRIFNESSN